MLELKRVVLEAPALPSAHHHVLIDLLAWITHRNLLISGDAEVVKCVVRTGIELKLYIMQSHVVVLCSEVDVVTIAVLNPKECVVLACGNGFIVTVLIGPTIHSGVLDDLESPSTGGELGSSCCKSAITLYESDAVLAKTPTIVVTGHDVRVLRAGHTYKSKGRHQKSKEFLHNVCFKINNVLNEMIKISMVCAAKIRHFFDICTPTKIYKWIKTRCKFVQQHVF